MANFVYNRGRTILGEYDWRNAANVYRMLLATNSYVPALADNVVSAVTNELSGGGYVRQPIINRTVSQNDGSSRADYLGDNPIWTPLSSTQTYRWAVLYRFGTVDGDSDLVVALDVGGATGINLTGLTLYMIQFDSQATNGRIFSVT